MKKRVICLTVGVVLLLSGCVTTPSQPRTFDQLGRFSTTPLNSQSYRISFQGHPNMNYGVAEEITLVKAAQTAVFNGFQFFKVLDDPSNRSQQPPRQAVVYPTSPYGYGGYGGYGRYGYGYRHFPGFYDPYYSTPQVINVDPVQVSYSISCYKLKKQAPEDAFDAHLILQSLGSKYGVNANGQVLQPQLPVSRTVQAAQ